MSNITTELKDWGSTGIEYPDGQKQKPGIAPVAPWHNFLFSHLISNVKDDLIPTVNNRVESYVGNTAPQSPEAGELFVDQDDSEVAFNISDSWKKVAWDVEVTNHKNNDSNPHGVTSDQIGAARNDGDNLNGDYNFQQSSTVSFENTDDSTQLRFVDQSGGSSVDHGVFVDLPLDVHNGTDSLILVDPVDISVDVPVGTLHEKGNRVSTRQYVDDGLSGKSDTGHVHDGRYYTENEVDNRLGDKADSGHNHDGRYLRSDQPLAGDVDFGDNDATSVFSVDLTTTQRSDHTGSDGRLVFNGDLEYYDTSGWKTVATQSWVNDNVSADSHNHDDRYFTESEVNNRLANKSDTDHLHDDRYVLQGESADTGNFTFAGDDLDHTTDGNVLRSNGTYLTINAGGTFSYTEQQGGHQINATGSHLSMFDTDHVDNKGWKVESNGGDYRVSEVGSGVRFAIQPGGQAVVKEELTVNGAWLEIPVHASNISGAPDGALYAVSG